MHHTEIPELQGAYDNIKEHFRKILVLLRNSKQQGDRAWREASKHLRFPEPPWLPLGYSGKGTSGRGIGPSLQKRLTETAKEIIDIGVVEPEIFELIGLLEENVGPDLISDMIGNIILRDFLQYSVRVFDELGFPSERMVKYRYEEQPFLLPTYTENNQNTPIVLVPRNILKPLPIMTSWDDIDSVSQINEEVRRQMDSVIGTEWKKATTKEKKQSLKKILLEHPDLFQSLIDDYRKAPPEIYDFLEDPAGFIRWVEAAHSYITKYPLQLNSNNVADADEVLKLVLQICNKFKQLIENNGLCKELYNEETGKPRREETSQKLLFAVADCYCEANNIDLTRESDAGRGPVDFKFSSGYTSRVLIELKLSKNDLMKGYTKQLEVYKKSERTEHAIFLVVIVANNIKKVEDLKDYVRSLKKNEGTCPELVVIDGRIKPSASNVT